MNYPDVITRETEARLKAETIIEQIGAGNRMACGFRDPIFSAGSPSDDYDVRVTAKVGRASRYIEVTLTLLDVYNVRLIKVPTARAKDQSLKTLESAEGVYAPSLGEVIYKMVNK